MTTPERDPHEVRRGLDIRANAAGWKARDAARVMLHHADSPGIPPVVRDEIYKAVGDLLDEMYRWKDSWASEHVDKDRQVRAAMARSADCEAHGEILRDLEKQVTVISESQDRTEAARLVMLGWYQACVTFADGARLKKGLGEPYPEAAKIIEWMQRQLPRVHSAHQRAWHKPAPSTGEAADSE